MSEFIGYEKQIGIDEKGNQIVSYDLSLNIKIKAKKLSRHVDVDAKLDTGAMISLFSIQDFARIVGISAERAEKLMDGCKTVNLRTAGGPIVAVPMMFSSARIGRLSFNNLVAYVRPHIERDSKGLVIERDTLLGLDFLHRCDGSFNPKGFTINNIGPINDIFKEVRRYTVNEVGVIIETGSIGVAKTADIEPDSFDKALQSWEGIKMPD